MKTALPIRILAALSAVLLLAGCEGGGCYDCGVEVVIGDPACCPHNSYELAVTVGDSLGYTLGGATVELVVAGVPEQRFYATTDRNGVAYFRFDALPDVAAIAYACAPGYQCNAVDIGTSPRSGRLAMRVVLYF
ncbi:MAG TPA: hypothetical protein PJ991_12745 [Kiritimatiellia bacterium]|nr:hypothetical protein [Kiritimatiellia bacterium]